jgi:pimeloyl-ACP methyl ester carboxylesterase
MTGQALANGSFTAPLNGFAIHYEVRGRGPVLMTLPNSWGLSLQGLRGLYRPLEERLTLVYFDPRGMGRSGPVREEADRGLAAVRADWDALRQHLGLGATNVIGWSNGAMNLVLLASERPGAVASAIFLHGAASYGPQDLKEFAARHPDLVERYAAFREEMREPSLGTEARTARLRSLWLGTFFPASFADPARAPEALQRVFGQAQFSWPHVDYSNRESATFDGRDRLKDIRARSLVIAGAHDTLPPAKARELAEGIAGAELVVFEKSGHFAPVEEAEAFRAAVFGFLGVK